MCTCVEPGGHQRSHGHGPQSTVFLWLQQEGLDSLAMTVLSAPV